MRVTDHFNPKDDDMMAAAERQAAHVAEHLLDHSNADAERELALDILNDYCDGIHVAMYGQRAMGLLAWEQVRADAATAEWERMGRR